MVGIFCLTKLFSYVIIFETEMLQKRRNKVLKKLLLTVPLFFVCFFLAIGYARVTNTLTITGSAEVTPQPKGIFITSVELVSSSGVTTQKATEIYPTSLITELNVSKNSTIT